jgi:hypothetical protein
VLVEVLSEEQYLYICINNLTEVKEMKKVEILKLTTAIVILFVMIGIISNVMMTVPTTAAPTLVVAPRIPLKNGSSRSLNWAGYVDVVKSGSVYMVNASWKVPNVQPSKGSTYVAIWVGIDGYNDSTVEQTGILAESQSGKVSYSAWYEFYPSPPVYAPTNDKVKPGDLIVAWVQYNSNGTFTTVLKDVNESWTFISPATSVSGAYRSSAEWIVERPSIGGSLTKLANFGTADFGEYYTLVAFTCYFNYLGTLTSIGNSNWYSITMVNYKGNILASPSSLINGDSFNVTYVRSS